jgi:hypothetical protein
LRIYLARANLRFSEGLIAKASRRFPLPSCATSERGCLPRPDQVSDGMSGFRYLGRTVGYARRLNSGAIYTPLIFSFEQSKSSSKIT